jgi:hypothetical protein
VVQGDPLVVNICHCLDCRHRTGSAFSYNAYFERESVQIEGSDKSYEREGQEGHKVRHHFCPNCGTTVFWDSDRNPARYGIAATLFGQPFSPLPLYSAWERVKCDWVSLPEGLTHFSENPIPQRPSLQPLELRRQTQRDANLKVR